MTARNFEIKETMLALPQKSETDIYHIELNRISLTEDEFIKIARAGLEKTGGI